MKRCLLAVSLALILTVSLVPVPACTPGASFQVAVLAISPQEVMEGGSVNVSANVTNDGGSEGTFEAVLNIDGVEVETKSLTLDAGEAETVHFTVPADVPGTHGVELAELAGSFSVFAAPEFENLVISPGEVETGEQVTISGDISNRGDIPGTYAVCLEVGGVEEETRTVTVAGGGTECPSFAVTRATPGEYTVTLGGLSGTLTVLSPAGFEFGNLVISPEEAVAGWPASIMCDVTNSGGAEGCCPVSLKVDGKEVETQDVTVSGGATETVAFSLVEDIGGSYAVAVGNLTGTLVVKEGALPIHYVGDQWVYRDISGGIAYTVTETVVGEELMGDVDCYVVEWEYDPVRSGVATETFWNDKETQGVIRMQSSFEVSGVVVTYSAVVSSVYSGDEYWPLQEGNGWSEEVTITQTWEVLGESETETVELTLDYEVEKIEDVTVAAGTFRCFKIVTYEDGQATDASWYSDKAKAFVKLDDLEGDDSKQLLSYSVR